AGTRAERRKRARLRLVLGNLARAPGHVLLAIAERGLELRIRLVAARGHGLLHARARVLMVEELGRRGALRLAHVLVALEVVRKRREAHRKIVAVAKPDAHRAVGGVGQRSVPTRMLRDAAALLILPEPERAAVLAACLLLVGGAAIVARQLAHDLVL